MARCTGFGYLQRPKSNVFLEVQGLYLLADVFGGPPIGETEKPTNSSLWYSLRNASSFYSIHGALSDKMLTARTLRPPEG